ncbi:protein NRT1/ PTR FAMILY 2.13-like [Carica papaya]|uniref:protein NRT1/ PTR FAMILY 2.13-like n=1 Tax=Carica papaya TaxID=3649 RepID=UPI000B8CA7BC|nr:protein NRT1/ PTR FAMILY 2.13-like [Carica papaya]
MTSGARENDKKKKKKMSSLWPFCSAKCFQNPSSEVAEPDKADSVSPVVKKQPGGWKTMPFILGNETLERLATIGLLANFMVYLMREFHMEQVAASNVLNIWSGITNFAPLLGAFISDAYVGKFPTIAVASLASFMGMVIVTLTAGIPTLHPPSCKPTAGNCIGPNRLQLGVLLTGLGFLTIGSAGIRPCSIPFGVDQFDQTTEEGIKGVNSFFNWYYTTFTIVLLITQTLVVYIQDSVSWVWGFGIPTGLMVASIVMFVVGYRIYVHAMPEGSIFSGIAQVCVAAFKKRRLKLPSEQHDNKINGGGLFYDPPLNGSTVLFKLPLTNQFRFLNKAAMIVEGDELKPDGSPANKWRLTSIQNVEEVKCLIKIIPIWASGIISFTAMSQQGTFIVSQAMNMDRHLGHNFQIPPGSISIISMITVGIWLPFYDRFMVPALRKLTKHEGGITLLQRIGIGIVFSVLAMVVAGLVEKERRAAAISHPNSPMSVMWLAPQLIVLGLCEAFSALGLIEFFNRQFPEHMRSIANSLLFCSFAGSSYLSTLLVNTVHAVTGGHGRPDWLANDINSGRLDYFYYLVAGLGVLNFIYFLYVARRYRYKLKNLLVGETPFLDVDLSSSKP